MSGPIKNIVFDIGNVIVRWDPELIIGRSFGPEAAASGLVATIFGDEIWLTLNRGEMTEDEAKAAYRKKLGLTLEDADRLFHHIRESLDLISGTAALIERLAGAGFRIFALSDNVHEIVAHLKARYDFWHRFEGAVISAEIGLLKPAPAIFEYLLETHDLVARETLFLDDVAANVAGAQAVGMSALQFVDAEQAEREMRALGVVAD